jgi:hypothetical protein
MKRYMMATTAAAVVISATVGANAATLIDKKLGQFGLEPRLGDCVKWASGDWPWPLKGGWKTCIGWKTEFLQHDFHLIVQGPPPEPAVRQILEEAAAAAAAAAIGTGVLTPVDPASRVAAALVGYLTTRGLERLVAEYDVHVDHRTFWS